MHATCERAILCQAKVGYDGPTGLGTLNGPAGSPAAGARDRNPPPGWVPVKRR